MAKSKSDISNSAIRIFLQRVGKFYDEARKLDPFVPNKKQKEELLLFFNNECCYCGQQLDLKSLSEDHLIPMNKTYLGLHAWGNVVPCCKACNNQKQQKKWDVFLNDRNADKSLTTRRKEKILHFVKTKEYDPSLNLHAFADNLYEDVGEVAMTLITLRYKQAEEAINAIIKKI
jgi:hypothetical protein